VAQIAVHVALVLVSIFLEIGAVALCFAIGEFADQLGAIWVCFLALAIRVSIFKLAHVDNSIGEVGLPPAMGQYLIL
jgi:hypothetical protein